MYDADILESRRSIGAQEQRSKLLAEGAALRVARPKAARSTDKEGVIKIVAPGLPRHRRVEVIADMAG